jgi:hypothetical protein
MGLTDRCLVALLALLATAPSVHAAKKCTDTSSFAAVMESVEASVPCASATKHGKYVKQAKQAVGSMLTGGCKKQFTKRFLENSTCGRSGFVVCCDANKKGKDISKVVKAGKCKGQVCTATAPTSVGAGCTPQGSCVTTTTTTTTTTIVVGPTTTTTTLAPPRCGDHHVDPGEACDSGSSTGGPVGGDCGFCTADCTCTPCDPGQVLKGTLDFTLSAAGGTCGTTQDGSSATIKNLTCGGLNIGGGASIIPEGPTPDGSISRFSISCCGPGCTIGPTSTAPAVNVAGPDCTDMGCNFGTPLPIPNTVIPSLTVCVLNTWSAAASGTLDLSTGASSTNVPLISDNYLTGNQAQPCPRCSATGTPASPGTGTCDRGPRATMACTTTSSTGLTRDCPTGGADGTHPCTPGGGNCIDGSHVGPINVNLSPLTDGTASKTDPVGNFCGQSTASGHQFGCFGSPACRTITETGAAAGAITPGTPTPATLASVFCIAGTGNGLVDGSADLPGPGAVSLPGQFVVTAAP